MGLEASTVTSRPCSGHESGECRGPVSGAVRPGKPAVSTGGSDGDFAATSGSMMRDIRMTGGPARHQPSYREGAGMRTRIGRAATSCTRDYMTTVGRGRTSPAGQPSVVVRLRAISLPPHRAAAAPVIGDERWA